jgi:hypothetical protein
MFDFHNPIQNTHRHMYTWTTYRRLLTADCRLPTAYCQAAPLAA